MISSTTMLPATKVMIPVPKINSCATFALAILLLGALTLSVGCGPEMPVPPPKVFGSTAEEDFDWVMERMKHAMERFQPDSSSGLSMKRELDYELFPPSEKNRRYTARVTMSTRTVFRAEAPDINAQRRRAKAKKEAAEIKLDDPYTMPGEENADEDAVPIPDIPLANLNNPEIADPRIPIQELKEKKEYLLEYVDGQWRLKTEGLEESEQMWFDYALEQGDFGPNATVKD